MSITFEPSENIYIDIFNKFYDPNLPENFLSNAKTIPEPLYFCFTLSNSNARRMLAYIGYNSEDLWGSIEFEELNEFIIKINELERKEKDEYVSSFLNRLDKVARICRHLQKSLTWG